MIEHNQIYVNGRWVDSTASSVIPAINPAAEQTVATIARGTAEDVHRAAEAAAPMRSRPEPPRPSTIASECSL